MFIRRLPFLSIVCNVSPFHIKFFFKLSFYLFIYFLYRTHIDSSFYNWNGRPVIIIIIIIIIIRSKSTLDSLKSVFTYFGGKHHWVPLSFVLPVVWFHTTPTEGICRMTSLPSGFSKISPQNLPPSPPEFPKFSHTPWKNCYLARMPNFVSFMYFLLNSTTDGNSFCAQVMKKLLKSSWPHANEMQGRVGNITVLFSHCLKKKATLEEV